MTVSPDRRVLTESNAALGYLAKSDAAGVIDARLAAAPSVVTAAAAAAQTAITAAAATGLETPNAGRHLTAFDYAFAVTDSGNRVSEIAIGPDGLVPQAILNAQLKRSGLDVAAPALGGVAAGFVDAAGYQSELVIDSTGSVPAWVLSRWGTRMGVTAPTTRVAPLSVTLPGGTYTDTATAAQLRWPLMKLAPSVKSARIHIRNRNERDGVTYTGALSFTGLWVGQHALNADGTGSGNFTTAPTQISGAFTTAADGSEWVSNWVSIDLGSGQDMLLSTAYTSAAQSNYQGFAGVWRSTDTSDAGSATPATALALQQMTPLDIWIECQISSRVPVIAYFGDSLSVGTGSTLPVHDSYGAKHALANHLFPVHYAQHGSTMQSWSNTAQTKWTRWASLTKPDAVLWALGSNDIFNGTSLAATQALFATVNPIVRSFLSSQIYLATIMPRNGSSTDATREGVRTQYNDWLRQLPGGTMGIYDFAASIEATTGGTVDTRYAAGDNVHLNTGGYARNANAIVAPLAHVTV